MNSLKSVNLLYDLHEQDQHQMLIKSIETHATFLPREQTAFIKESWTCLIKVTGLDYVKALFNSKAKNL